jgi:PhzF family phenazine biosynthesis protein
MRQWTVDAFAARPFMGNPACVVEPFDAWPEDGWMQALAKENNQAETAFLLKLDEPGRYGLRWYTPGTEVPLCGHATLGAAHVLLGELGVDAREIAFETRFVGELRVRCAGGGYEMNVPADPPEQTDMPEGLVAAIGAEPVEVWSGQYLVAVVENEAAVRTLNPDIPGLGSIGGARGAPGQVVVASVAAESSPYDVVSRFFAPGCGVNEDPTTGSAHCILAPLFSDKLGRSTLRFHQAYPGRGGDLECEMKGERVLIRGQAVTVMETMLRL